MVTENDICDNYSYASCVNLEIEKTPEPHPKKLEFNIDKSEAGLKKIDFNIAVNDDEIDEQNDNKVVHPSDDITADDYSNIEDRGIQQEQTNYNSVYTIVDNKLQSNCHLEDQNKTNDWKITNNHEGKIVIAYNTNTANNTLHSRTLYVIYIGPDDNSNDHLIFKPSTN